MKNHPTPRTDSTSERLPWHHPTHEAEIAKLNTEHNGGVRIKGSCGCFIQQVRTTRKLPVVTMDCPCKSCMEKKEDDSALKLAAAISGKKLPAVDPLAVKPRKVALRDGQFADVDPGEVDFELPSSNAFLGSHANMIPLQSSVAGARVFYGARFANQALPLIKGEAPLVQNIDDTDKDGRSFDEIMGDTSGNVRAKNAGRILALDKNFIEIEGEDGVKEKLPLYHNFPFNRKSVTGDSVIVIKRDAQIWRGRIAHYHWKEGDLTWSIDPSTFQPAWFPVRGYICHHNDKQLLRVQFSSGRSVIVTEDHSLITLDDSGKLTPVYPKNCTIGITRSPLVYLPEAQAECRKGDLYKWGVLAGLYLAEGYLSQQAGLVSIAVEPADRKLQIETLLSEMLPHVKPHVTEKNVDFTDFSIYEWLLGCFGTGSSLKFISNRVFNQPVEFRVGLLHGYLSGDGCLWADTNGALQMTAVSVSKEVRDGMVDVCASLGILTTLFDAPRAHLNSEWNDGFGFRVCCTSYNRLDRWFFYSDREQKFRDIVKPKYRASEFEAVPISKHLRKSLYKSFPKRPEHYVYKSASDFGYVSKQRMLGCSGLFGRLAIAECFWDTIVNIDPVPHEALVYDLSVEGSEMFSVNGGIIVHNTSLHNTPMLKVGDSFKPGQLLARSNYTDDNGTMAMGLNARVGLVPYLGKTMDDAIVVSEAFAKRMTSSHLYGHDMDYKRGVKAGKNHFISLFPQKFNIQQVEKLDDDGVVQIGQTVEPGDPIVLATKPRVISSTSSQLGMLSKHMKNARNDASQIWDHNTTGTVIDVKKLKSGVKVNIATNVPTTEGDKIVFRSGQKGIISQIIPDDHMPRTTDGKPLEVLLNPLGIPSRVNNSLPYEIMLGKVARKRGQAMKLPSFTKPGEKWYDIVQRELDAEGLQDKEEVFDPKINRKLENPVTVGDAYVLKLHHTAESKMSARGQGSYDQNAQPIHGGGEFAQAKRLSGLEAHSFLSAGAYNVLREGATVRGQKNDEYWRKLRMGQDPGEPGEPFVWNKFKALLMGAGYMSRKLPKGVERLTFFTDKDLEERRPIEVKTGDLVDLGTMEPTKGGLFDSALTGNNAWGYIKLPFPVVNPAAEDSVRKLLGLTQKQYRAIMAGEMELPEHLRHAPVK